ncbi:TMF family protein [Chitinophaga arvensicola]|uniref:Uncharacterized protein n=1 Tax=Chitinophaga arvensicola TaxID=29529 RepID=A0A1I0S793_9BACT|nr:TMF family protein [Chitinophaga arvensicola]SEW51585.1 hypothetical protein SAMN04488122_4343 [Chitinophaga arvensicola]
MKKCLFTIALGFIIAGVHAQDLQTVTTNGNKTTNRLVLGPLDDGFSKLQVAGGISLNAGLSNASNRPALASGTSFDIRGQSNTSYYADDGFLRLSAGGGLNANMKSYIDLSGYSTVPDMYMNIVFGTYGTERMRINSTGNVGIGVPNPSQKLEVNGMIVSSVTNADIGGVISLLNPAKTAVGAASRWSIFNMSGTYGNSLQFWAYDNQGCGGGLCNPRLTLMDNGNVGIGTSKPQSLLSVAGTVTAQKVKVTLTGWADYVFDPGYVLPSLSELERYIAGNKHLPDIPAEAEIIKEGLDMGEMQQKQMQKIEELTLYLIAQNKKLEKQQQLILKQEQLLSQLNDRLKALEGKSSK